MSARPRRRRARRCDARAIAAGEARALSAARLRDATAADAGGIAAIYASYVRETAITFETAPPDAAEMARRISAAQASHAWLVAEDAAGALLGYAYAAPFKERTAYRQDAETTIYLDPRAHGQVLGRRLYAALLTRIGADGIVAAIGVIALPNAASIGLHEALGFARVGLLEQVGYKLGRWHDVGCWQKELAPRAATPAEPRGGD